VTQQNIAFFTPSMNDPALLEAIFTARSWLAEQVIAAIRDSVQTDSRHYLLLHGPRGIGKTHLVSLVYYRVKRDESLDTKLRIAWLQEDPYAVSSYPRLLRAILSQLDHDYSLPGWQERLSEIENLDDTNQIERSLEYALLEYLNGRVLLLIMENLDEVFAGLGDDGQKKLRAFLQTRSLATILATSTSLLPDLEERDRPFFGTFKKYPLPPFSFQDCVDVLVRIAEFRHDHILAETLRSPKGRARIHAIHHLAGGNPRIYVMFYQFLSRESLDQLILPFMKLVDELMPYYQARMQTISPQQRTLIDIIRRNESPIAVRDISKAAFITSQSASRELKTLRDLGYVESNQVGRESLYELREPLMRICLSAKEQRGQALPLFIEFLRIWFTPTELEGMSTELASQTRDYEAYRNAIEESHRKHGARLSYEYQKIATLLMNGEDDLAVARLISLNAYAPDNLLVWHELTELLLKRRNFDILINLTRIRTQVLPEDGQAWNDLNYANYLAGNFEAALDASSQAIALMPNDPVVWKNHLVNLQNLKRSAELRRDSAKALAIRENAESANYWDMRGFCLTILNRWEEAAESFVKGLALHEDDYDMWRALHVALENLSANPSRVKVAEFAVELFPGNALSWRDYATTLGLIHKDKEALDAQNKAIELAPNEEYLKGEQLYYFLRLNNLGGARSSLDHFDAMRKQAGAAYPLYWRVMFWLASGNLIEAANAFEGYVEDLRINDRFSELSAPVWIVSHSKDPVTWKPAIDLWIEVFEKQGELAALGPALVRGLTDKPAIFTAQSARDWTDAWQATAGNKPQLTIPLRLMEVCTRFIETGDRAVILELPLEQRALLEPEIDRYLRAAGRLRTDVDHEIDELIENIRRKRAVRAAALVPKNVAAEARFLKFENLDQPSSWLTDRINEVIPVGASVGSLRVAESLFWPGAQLLAIGVTGEKDYERFALVWPSQKFVPMNWTNEPIYHAAERNPLNLSTDRNAILYCRFFFHFVRGQLGTFCLTENLEEIHWADPSRNESSEVSKEATVEQIEEARRKVGPLLEPVQVLVRDGDKSITLSATMVFKNALFRSKVLIALMEGDYSTTEGESERMTYYQISLFDEDLLLEDLPVIVDGPPSTMPSR